MTARVGVYKLDFTRDTVTEMSDKEANRPPRSALRDAGWAYQIRVAWEPMLRRCIKLQFEVKRVR